MTNLFLHSVGTLHHTQDYFAYTTEARIMESLTTRSNLNLSVHPIKWRNSIFVCSKQICKLFSHCFKSSLFWLFCFFITFEMILCLYHYYNCFSNNKIIDISPQIPWQ